MDDDLERFIDAQADSHDRALAEIRNGRKRTHWMWFIFPQIAGLGHSAMAQRFAIRSLDEARAYLAHPVLGQRLRECVAALRALPTSDPVAVFGPVDAMKLQSSLTLFGEADPGQRMFGEALARWFKGVKDRETLRFIAAY
jgi:uncharacterized protein (DUF1810 family)